MRFTRWDQEMTTNATTEVCTSIALRHLSLADCEDSRRVSALISAGDLLALCSYELDYAGISPQDAFHVRSALALFSKRSDLTIPGVDPEEAARLKFLETEELCRQTNELYRARASGKACLPPDVEAVFYRAQRIIARILGEVPRLADLRPRFGPGATTQVKKRDACPRNKLGKRIACSRDLMPLATVLMDQMPAWALNAPHGPVQAPAYDVFLDVGKLGFALKNALIKRVTVTEPELNGVYQLPIGDGIADRLRRFGVDTRDQSRNQRLACVGSITGALATLDLSSASDTIAIEVVYDLLPVDWAHFLSRFRTGTIVMGKTQLKLQKFSSMGNGFTFPLETLIFYGLAYAASEDHGTTDVSVYGDDIIVPTAAYPLLVRALRCAGFIPNVKKSFASGPFRESCGKDYHSGNEIRPFYMKGPLSGEKAFIWHNYYARKGHLDFASEISKLIDPALRIYGPDGFGDGHLIGVHPRAQKATHSARGFSGYTFDTFTWKKRYSFRVCNQDRVLPFYSIYANPPPGEAWITSRHGLYGRTKVKPGTSVASSLEWGYTTTSALQYDEKGALGVTTPGADGYKRISIYTLGT